MATNTYLGSVQPTMTNTNVGTGGVLGGAAGAVNQGTLNGAVSGAAGQGGAGGTQPVASGGYQGGAYINSSGNLVRPDFGGGEYILSQGYANSPANTGQYQTYNSTPSIGQVGNAIAAGGGVSPSTGIANGVGGGVGSGGATGGAAGAVGGAGTGAGAGANGQQGQQQGGGQATGPGDLGDLESLLNQILQGQQTSGGGLNIDPNASKTPILAPNPGAYGQAMTAEQGALQQGMNGANAGINRGIDYAKDTLQGGLMANNTTTDNGVNAVNSATTGALGQANQYIQPTMQQFQGVTANTGNDLQGYRNAVQGNFNQKFQDFQNSDAYNFALNQGLTSAQNSAAAGGMLRSGATLKALQDYASGYASQQYNNWQQNQVANAGGLANSSLGALSSQGQLANQAGLGLGNIQTQGGQQLADLYKNQGTIQGQLRLGTAQTVGDLASQQAQASGQYGTALADSYSRGILGQGTTVRYV